MAGTELSDKTVKNKEMVRKNAFKNVIFAKRTKMRALSSGNVKK